MEYKIHTDDYPQDPREWDNLGTMICFHRGYTLGDKQNILDSDDFNSWDEQRQWLMKNDYIYLPLYLYDHSGITMNTTGFSCRWDSGQVGWIVMSHDEIKSEWSVKRISKQLREKVYSYLRDEVKTYDHYLTGEVYGYEVLDDDGEHLDSCWGYYSEEEAEAEAKNMLEYHQDLKQKQKQSKVKAMIKNHVPLMARL